MGAMIFKLQGTFQHYVWGGRDFIPNWQNLIERETKPYAEYWLGAHRSSPSKVVFQKQWLPLDSLLDNAPELLGKASCELFGAELPFLLKILDVAQPLSIQIHPTKTQAEIGFEREEQAGIALNAVHRTYKDRNHKPEMMIALSDFWLLHGFQPMGQIRANLCRYPSLQELAKMLDEKGIKVLYPYIMQAKQAQLSDWLLPIIHARQSDFEKGDIPMKDPDYWILSTMQAMHMGAEKLDAGLLCFYLFNIVNVKKGEGIYQGAGLPHAYLRGQCIELMAASDNVIRGGLTPKYIDVPALLQTVDYREIIPHLIAPAPETREKAYLYPTPEAEDFALLNVKFDTSQASFFELEHAAILLVMEGNIMINSADKKWQLTQGEAIFIGAESSFELVAEQEGYAMIATLPPKKA